MCHLRLQVLPNHAIFGDLFDLLDYAGPYVDAETVAEGRIRFSRAEESVFIQSEGIAEPGAEIVGFSRAGCGGVVHVIDRVLLPARFGGAMVDLGTSTERQECTPIAAILAREGLTTFTDVVTVATESLLVR